MYAIESLGGMNLVGAQKCVIDSANNFGYAIGGIQTLIGIHLAGKIGIGGNLPAGEVNCFQPGFHLLQCLIACEGTKRLDI